MSAHDAETALCLLGAFTFAAGAFFGALSYHLYVQERNHNMRDRQLVLFEQETLRRAERWEKLQASAWCFGLLLLTGGLLYGILHTV